MGKIGVSRRYVCSLTIEQKRKVENDILKKYVGGKIDNDNDERLYLIKKSLKVRGYLRCGVPLDSIKTKKGETLKTTKKGLFKLRQ